jgi:hypothetical protein
MNKKTEKPTVVNSKKQNKPYILAIRLDKDILSLISHDANTKGMGPSTLGRMIIYDHYKVKKANEEK